MTNPQMQDPTWWNDLTGKTANSLPELPPDAATPYLSTLAAALFEYWMKPARRQCTGLLKELARARFNSWPPHPKPPIPADEWKPPPPPIPENESEEQRIRRLAATPINNNPPIMDVAESQQAICIALLASIEEGALQLPFDPPDQTRRITPAEIDPPDADDGSSTWLVAHTFHHIHAAWKACQDPRPDHPLKPLIEAWLTKRPEPIRSDTCPKAIAPHGLISAPPAARTHATQLALLDTDGYTQLPGRVEQSPAQLPLLAEVMDSTDIPLTPLWLADAAGFHGLQPGRGARLDKRLLIFGLLAMSLSQREPDQSYEWRPTLRELRDLLWPARATGPRGGATTSFRPGKHGPGLLSALRAVNLAEIQLADGYTWRPMRVWGNPTRDLDSRAIIEIRLPGGCDRGPLIDRPALIAAGTISDPAFNLEIGLAYIWDDAKTRNRTYRIHATQPEVRRNADGHILDIRGESVIERGKPVTRWDHAAAVRTGHQIRHPQADKVRVLTRTGRHRLAYGPETRGKDKNQVRRERENADRLLEDMEAAGRITIEPNAADPRTGKHGWRILENWIK